ncbi:MAG: hypothetical protein OCC49_14400 [Fibrobacterales bacterium]
MVEFVYNDRDDILFITYKGNVHLQDMYEMVQYHMEYPDLPEQLRVFLDSRKGNYAFPINEFTLGNLGLDRLQDRFESISIAVVGNSDISSNESYFYTFCEKMGISVSLFHDESKAWYHLKKMHLLTDTPV